MFNKHTLNSHHIVTIQQKVKVPFPVHGICKRKAASKLRRVLQDIARIMVYQKMLTHISQTHKHEVGRAKDYFLIWKVLDVGWLDSNVTIYIYIYMSLRCKVYWFLSSQSQTIPIHPTSWPAFHGSHKQLQEARNNQRKFSTGNDIVSCSQPFHFACGTWSLGCSFIWNHMVMTYQNISANTPSHDISKHPKGSFQFLSKLGIPSYKIC